MSRRDCFGDVQAVVRTLGTQEIRVLELLAQAPLLSTDTARVLTALGSSSTGYRCMERLFELRLVERLRPLLGDGSAPRLYHLTDLGIAAVAEMHGLDPVHLARRYRLRGEDLAIRIDGLPYLMSLYQLAVGILPGSGRLVRWVCPWRGRYLKPSVKTVQNLSLPAYAEVTSGEEGVKPYLLLPDQEERPLASYKSMLNHLAAYAAFHRGEVPDLVVATTSEIRVLEWEDLLETASGGRRASALPGYVFTWDEVRQGLAPHIGARHTARSHAAAIWVRRAGVPPPSRKVPRQVGTESSGHAGHNTSPADRDVLELIGQHPFLDVEDLACVLGCTQGKVTDVRRRLLRSGLLGEPRESEMGTGARNGPTELAADGLAIVAAGAGLTPQGAVRTLGLSGGGAEEPFGQRRTLARNIEHTLGVNSILVGLYRVVERWRRAGCEYYVTNWRSAAACAQRDVRPDGCAELWLGPLRYEFALEYDRGTESEDQLIWKFDAYRRLYDVATGAVQTTVLVVTTNPAQEGRIAGAVLAACTGRAFALPVLITTQERLHSERDGMLARIWREPVDRGRRHWLVRPRRLTMLGYGFPPSESCL